MPAISSEADCGSKLRTHVELNIMLIKKQLTQLNTRIRPQLYLVILVLASVVASYLALPPSFLPLGGDNILPAFSGSELVRYLSAWNQWTELGSNVPQVLAGPPITAAAILSLFQWLGLSAVLSSWFYFTMFMAIGALGSAYLFRTVFPQTRNNQVSSVISGLVFLFNPSLVVDTFKSLWLALPERAFFPIFIALFISGFQRRDLTYSLLCGASSFVLLATFPVGSAQYLIAAIAFIGFYLTIVVVTSQKRNQALSFAVKYIALLAVTTVAVNGYLVYPFMLNIHSYTSSLSSFPLRGFSNNNWSGVLNTLRLLSFWGFYKGYAPYSSSYQSSAVVVLSTLALPCLSFATLLFSKSRRVLAVAATTAIVVFVAKGNNAPLGETYSQIVSFSIFKVFYVSSVFISFLVLLYSLLLALFHHETSVIIERLRSRSRFILGIATPIVLLSILIVSSWPLVTGNVGSDYQQPLNHGVNIPFEYSMLRQWINSQNNTGRILLAYTPSVYVSTEWGFQGSQQFYQNYLDSSLITGVGTQYSSTAPSVSYAYGLQHFTEIDPTYIQTLENATRQFWTSYQGDSMSLENSGFNNTSSIEWNGSLVGSSAPHQISYRLPFEEDWSSYSMISIWVSAGTNLMDLSFGIMDSRGTVTWHRAADDVSRVDLGWTQLLVPLTSPSSSNTDLKKIVSIWAQIEGKEASFSIGLSLIQVARGVYDSIDWARYLALLGVSWVLEDSSLVTGSWQEYSILGDSSAFDVAFTKGFLTLYKNDFYTGMIRSANTVTEVDSLLALGNLLDSSSFDLNNSTFTLDQYNEQFNSTVTLSATVGIANYSISATASGPFVLVFNEAYDTNWILSDATGSFNNHIEINGFANGWVIDRGGTYKFELTYSPQMMYSAVLASSFAVLAAIILLPIILKFRARVRKRHESIGLGGEKVSSSA